MDEAQKKTLLKIARDSVEAAVCDRSFKPPACDDPELTSHRGCFVTLKNGEELRGCIGQFTADKPLCELIANMARASSTGDMRFFGNQITLSELPQLDIEISVLSELKKTDDPLSLQLGVDGIYIKKGFSSGCFLPQVAKEAGWNKEQFLSYCCSHKAGLSADAWKDPKTEVYLFTAEIFSSPFGDL